MLIPRILHQTWKTREVPRQFRRFYDSWRNQHPHWKFRLYDDADCRELVVRDFPELLTLYDGLPRNIQRADLFRYLVVCRYGGVYADLDMQACRSIEPLLAGRTCVFGIEAEFGEPLRRRLNYRNPYQVANCIFAAVPDHPFFRLLLDRIRSSPADASTNAAACDDTAVEDTTGPRFLTRVFQEEREQFPDITLLPQINWIPPHRPAYPNCFPFNVNIYCRHHFVGSWKTRAGGAKAGFLQQFRERWYHPSPWPGIVPDSGPPTTAPANGLPRSFTGTTSSKPAAGGETHYWENADGERRDAVITICTVNYLHYARALAQSIREQQPGLPVFACVVDGRPDEFAMRPEPLLQTFCGEDLPIPAWRRFAFQYRPLELCAALVPWAVEHVQQTLGRDRVIYLDCDIQVYASLTPLFDAMGQCDVILTPHLNTPLPDDGEIPDEIEILRHGTYNAGFLAVRKSIRARRFIEWWQSKLQSRCILEGNPHIYANQRYLDLVPTLFDGVRIERGTSYNVAYWNLSERKFGFSPEGMPTVDGDPLTFFHFSNFDPERPESLTTHSNRVGAHDMSAVRRLLRTYVARLNECGREECRRRPYGFQSLSDGVRIRDEWRTALRLQSPSLADLIDPFDADAVSNLTRRLESAVR